MQNKLVIAAMNIPISVDVETKEQSATTRKDQNKLILRQLQALQQE